MHDVDEQNKFRIKLEHWQNLSLTAQCLATRLFTAQTKLNSTTNADKLLMKNVDRAKRFVVHPNIGRRLLETPPPFGHEGHVILREVKRDIDLIQNLYVPRGKFTETREDHPAYHHLQRADWLADLADEKLELATCDRTRFLDWLRDNYI